MMRREQLFITQELLNLRGEKSSQGGGAEWVEGESCEFCLVGLSRQKTTLPPHRKCAFLSFSLVANLY
jgi:hypothetical protein